MALQIRNGLDSEWESNNYNIKAGEMGIATDSERTFIGVSDGEYMELSGVENIAPVYDSSSTYNAGDYVMHNGQLYMCYSTTTGAWDSAHWKNITFGEVMEELKLSKHATSLSGDLITFTNPYERTLPFKDLYADITAVQDLHGYDHPWVGGAGKNLFPLDVATIKSLNTSGTWNGDAYTVSGVTFTLQTDDGGNIVGINVNGTASETINFLFLSNNIEIDIPVERLTMNTGGTGSSSTTARVYFAWYDVDNEEWRGSATDSYTTPRRANKIQNFKIQVFSGSTPSNMLYKPMLNAGTSALPFEPYSNICPISGWTGANAFVYGKNLFDKSTVTYGVRLTTNTGATEPSANYAVSDYIPVVANVPVFIPNSKSARRWFYDINKVAKTYLNYSADQVFTPTEDGYIRITLSQVSGDSIDVNTYQVEFGSRATDYHAYTGETYPVTWTDQGTIYGGTIDFTTGVLTKKYASGDLGNLGWVKANDGNGHTIFYANTNVLWGTPLKSTFDILCSSYKVITSALYADDFVIRAYGTDSWSRVAVRDDRYASGDATAFKTAMNGVQLVYELATPVEYQLTAQEIDTLIGVNNVWADCGETHLTYYSKEN